MAQNWPTRYRCRKCTRSTSNYPFFCTRPECPIKRDWLQDNWFGITLLLVFLGIMFFSSGK